MARYCGFNLIVLMLIHYEVRAQNNNSQDYYKVISFGEKIDFGHIDQTVIWTLANAEKNLYSTLRGNEINAYAFQEPGVYDITFQESKKHDDACMHESFPDRFRVKVEPVKIAFDFSKITFSEPIVRGRNYSDLIITVPAKISSREKSAVKLPMPGISIAGIGVALTGAAAEKEIMAGNITKLMRYKLSGIVNQETYLMFDFYDFNNQVQTYNLPQVIK